MQVPRRIKTFKWRACRDISPTLNNLRKKKVEVEDRCCFCKAVPEDVRHALVSFPSFRDLWKNYVPVMQQLTSDMDFLDVITCVLDRGTNSDFTMFFLITWGLLFRRNKMQMEKILIQPSQVINHALSLRKSFNDLRSSSTQIAKRMCYWEPPPRGFLKLNVDGAMFSYLRKAGVGVVRRDNKGKLVMAASKMRNEVEDPATIKLLDLLRGLQPCVHLGFSKIVVESDCLLMVQE
ncbi:uncharacterized protein LOC121255225 [Juglans microcarpa x Juglans regia]|uniref:uncharacterized protein LOC121255225 n=1 Tax=Juglans microcarpa x Juglans regia TaxID=2249226 RepID=UPI001B7E20CD|nr:uncharacterized protein LOC121255225 [Juglans microcarpa x Juglans regia]